MAFDISLSGLKSSLTRLRTTANNVANTSTAGFKESRTNNVESAGGGTHVASFTRNQSQGALQITDNSLDLAISGPGYFQVKDSAGKTSYTRDGQFQVDRDGYVVDKQGQRLQGYQTDANGNQSSQLGDVKYSNGAQTSVAVATFDNPQGLQALGNNDFAESAESGAAKINSSQIGDFGSVYKGSVENSNVDLDKQVVSMLESKYQYQANVKVIKTESDMIGKLIDHKA